tara:strand:+ start:6194 stop:8755 length:2562 start_codon:yes stop_codon:yes gene_type:complete
MKLTILTNVTYLKPTIEQLIGALDAKQHPVELVFLEGVERLNQTLSESTDGCVLIWGTAEAAIAEALKTGDSDQDAMGRWLAQHRILPELCFEHRERLTLLQAEQIATNPSGFATLLSTLLELEDGSATVNEAPITAPEQCPLAFLVAREWVAADTASSELQAELSALSHSIEEGFVQTALAQEARQHYQTLLANSASLKVQLTQTKLAEDGLQQQWDQAEIQAQGQSDQITAFETQLGESQTARQTLETERQTERDNLHKQAKLHAEQLESQTSETELLLLQLHQVQEELEQTVIQIQQQAEQCTRLQTQLSESQSVRQTLETERQTERDNLHKQTKLHAEQLESQTSETELLLLQLHQVQEEMEEHFLQSQNSQKSVDELNLRLAQADKKAKESSQQLQVVQQHLAEQQAQSNKLDESIKSQTVTQQKLNQKLANTEQQLKQQSEAQKAELAHAQADLASSEQALHELRPLYTTLQSQHEEQLCENELLLLQLHQVQEELEHYFVRFKETEMNFTALDQRQQDMALQAPYFCSASDVTLLAESQDDQFKTLDCQIEQLEHFDSNWELVNVKVLNHENRAGLEFRAPTADHHMPLPGYTETGSDEVSGYMVIFPETETGSALIQRLGTSDSQRIRGIAQLLKARLKTDRCQLTEGSQSVNRNAWVATLDQFLSGFDKTPVSLGYDDVALEEVFQTPGYEHLWLKVSNLSYQSRLFPEFSVKLAAKEVDQETFTNYGCLEFRDQASGIAPFQTWPPEESDEFGPLLALELPETLSEAQRQIWSRLTSEDSAFVAALVQKLAQIIDELEQRGESLGRPAAQWLELLSTFSERQSLALLANAPVAEQSPDAATAP